MKLSLGASAAYGVHWMGFPAKAQVKWLPSARVEDSIINLQKCRQQRPVSHSAPLHDRLWC